MSNTNEQVAAVQQPSTRGVIRGRGRGGGRGGNRNGPKAGIAKALHAKVGPTRLLETEWVKDAALKKDTSFIYAAISGKAGDQQWTFHHPIGETPLDARQWVATPTRDVPFLLQRKENEALSAWKRQKEMAIKAQVLHRNIGRGTVQTGDEVAEVWAFADAPAIQPTIKTCMAAAKAAGANESAWLDYADRAVQVAERSFKEAIRTMQISPAWLEVNPKPSFETKGGALGDIPQRAVGYLNGLSLAAARDKVTRVAIGLERADDLSLPREVEALVESMQIDDEPADDDESSEDEAGEPATRPAAAEPKGKAPAQPKSRTSSGSRGQKKSA